MNNATSYTVQRNEKIQWLINNGLAPLPVAPRQDPRKYHKTVKANKHRGAHCPLTVDLEPIALFTGKNPSYLDKFGKPHLVNHQS